MNVFDVLKGVQDARARIEIWGVSLTSLLWIGLIALIVFAFSLREVLGWYLKLNDVRRELREVKAQLAELNQKLR